MPKVQVSHFMNEENEKQSNSSKVKCKLVGKTWLYTEEVKKKKVMVMLGKFSLG